MKGVLPGGQLKLKEGGGRGGNKPVIQDRKSGQQPKEKKKRKGNTVLDGRLQDNSPVQEMNRYFTNLGVCRLQLILSSLQMATHFHMMP